MGETPLPETCSHPLARVVWRGGEEVWCWACRVEEDAPRLLSKPEAWMVIQRFRALDVGGPLVNRRRMDG